MKRPKSDYAIQTVQNAMRLLECFGEQEELGVTELGHRLGLHKNNVFRLLATLEGLGYVAQSSSSERYELGVGCLQLGHAFSRGRSLPRLARRALEQMVHSMRESAHLAVLRDFEVVHADGEEPEQAIRASRRLGRLPAHCTALGKVLLACAEPELLERYDCEVVSRAPLAARTPSTITDRDKLFEHLRSVAGQGFATDLEECDQGLCCAAVPVYDATGRLVAALSVSGPVCRLDPERLLCDVVPQVRSAGEQLSRQLGWH